MDHPSRYTTRNPNRPGLQLYVGGAKGGMPNFEDKATSHVDISSANKWIGRKT